MNKKYYFSFSFLILSPSSHDKSIVHRDTYNLVYTFRFQIFSSGHVSRQMCLKYFSRYITKTRVLTNLYVIDVIYTKLLPLNSQEWMLREQQKVLRFFLYTILRGWPCWPVYFPSSPHWAHYLRPVKITEVQFMANTKKKNS